MRKTIYSFTLFLLTFICQGQNELIELSNLIKETNNIEKLKTIRNKNLKTFYLNDLYVEIERKLDFELKHLRIIVNPIPGEIYVINIIHKNDSIIIGNVSEQSFSSIKKIKSQIYFANDTDLVKEYVKKHNLKYNSTQTESDFYDTLMKEYRIGFGCGEVGDYVTPISKKTLRLIRNKNYKKLNKFLTSINPELQTLGTIGLIRLDKINEEQKKIIEHLKERNSVIFSCGGCVFNFGETYKDRIKFEKPVYNSRL